MKTRYLTSALLLSALAAGLRIARAEQRKPEGGPYQPSVASASAGAAPEPPPQPVNGKRPWAPVFAAEVPETPSDPPTKEEWARAPDAPEVRITAPDCRAQRVREHYRIQCGASHWIGLVAGSREGVSFGCTRRDRESIVCDEAWVIFPARRGDRRSFELFAWSKWGPAPDSVVTEQFLPGDPYPLISVQGLHWGF